MIRTILTSDGIKYANIPTYYPYPYPHNNVEFTITATETINDKGNKSSEYIIPLDYLLPRPIFQPKQTYYESSVNNDRELRRIVTKYFWEKFKNNWVYEHFNNLLKYFKVDENGNVSYITSLTQPNSESKYNDAKSAYIVNIIFSRLDMESLLERYVKKTGANWYELKTLHKSQVRDYVHEKIEKHIKNRIAGY